MVANAGKFISGIKAARKSLAGWGKTAGGDINAVASGIGSLYTGLRNTVTQLAMFGAVAGTVAAVGLGKVIMAGSSLVENQNKLKAVLGASSKVVVDSANEMATAFGVSKNEFMDVTGKLAMIFKGANYASDGAANLGIHFSKLALDCSSFFDVPVEEALQKIESGLIGNIRPLRDFGVDLSDVAVTAYAAKMGIGTLGAELTQAEKVQARTGLITLRLKDAMNDLSRTSGDVANSARAVTGRIKNLAGEIGLALQPIARDVLGQINEGLGAMSILWENNKTDVLNWALGMTTAGQEGANSMGFVQSAIGGIADAWQNVRIKFMQYQVSLTSGVAWMVQNLPGFAKGVERIQRGLFGGKEVSEADFKKTWTEDLGRLQEEQQKKLAGAMAAPKASEAVNAAFAASREQIKAAQAGGMGYQDISKIKPGADPFAMEKPGKGKLEFAKAASAGSSEASNAILRSKYGGGTKGSVAVEQTAHNTAEVSRKLDTLPQQMARALGTILGGGSATDLAMNLGNF